MRNNHIISEFRETKAKSFEVIILSICMALGINILASGIMLLVEQELAVVFIVIGIILTTLTFIILFMRLLKSLNKNEEIKGFFIYDNVEHDIVSVSEYGISEDMNRYLNAAFEENEAIKTHWKTGELRSFKPVKVGKDKHILAKASESPMLLVELLEYCVLEKLSLVICDYFNRVEKGKNKTQEYSREDIADILLSNRFLNLFSEPMNNRGAFVDSNYNDNVVSAYGPGGVIYSRFDLVLPNKSKLKRVNKNTILIDMKSFTLKISCLFGGFNTFLDSSLHKYYVGLNKGHSDYQFDINIEVKWKWKALLYFNDWKYYEWIDIFIEKLYEYADKETFLKTIKWDAIRALITCMERK